MPPFLRAQVGDAVERPPGAFPVVSGSAADLVGVRYLLDAAVERRVDRHRGIVPSEPDDAADRIGKPLPRLGHRHIGAVVPGYAPLTQLPPPPVHLQEGHHVVVHEGIRVWALLGLSVLALHDHELGHVEFGSLVGVAEDLHDLFQCDERVGFNAEGIVLGVRIEPERWGEQVEHPPFPAACRHASPAFGVVCIAELERLSGVRIPPSVSRRYIMDICARHVVFRIIEVDRPDPARIRVHSDMIVGNALCRPYRPDFVLAASGDLDMPYLGPVGDRQAFPPVIVPVLLRQFVYEPYRLTCRFAPLEREAAQLVAADQGFLVSEFLSAAECRLADRELMLVHAWIGRVDVSEGLGYLGYPARHRRSGRVVRMTYEPHAAVDRAAVVPTVLRPLHDIEPGPVLPAVAGMRSHHRSVGRRLPAQCYRRTGEGLPARRQKDRHGDRKDCRYTLHRAPPLLFSGPFPSKIRYIRDRGGKDSSSSDMRQSQSLHSVFSLI